MQEDSDQSRTLNNHLLPEDNGIQIIPFMTAFSTMRTRKIVLIQGLLILTLLGFQLCCRNLTISKVSENVNVTDRFSNLPSGAYHRV